MLRALWKYLRRREHGQDLAEYCMITALVALVALAVFIHVSGGIQSLWTTADSTLVAGDSAAPSGGGSPALASSPAKSR